MEKDENLHTISSLPVQRDLSNHLTVHTPTDPQKSKQIAMLLAKLAVHYYRPDFTEGAAQSLISDMVDDLQAFGISAIESAIKEYRINPENRFFPNSGQLLAILRPAPSPGRLRLQTYRAPEETWSRKLKPVNQILIEHGFPPLRQPTT